MAFDKHCACPNQNGEGHHYVNCAKDSCIDCCLDERKPSLGLATSKKRVATGQPVTWRKQSGSTDGGTILGLTTTQLLIAGAVGVGAYLLMKKKK